MRSNPEGSGVLGSPNGAGNLYPCIHTHWRVGYRHDDPGVKPGIPKWDELLAAVMQGKRVIETKDFVPDDEGDPWERTDYIALWEIDDVTVDPNPERDGYRHLRFRFARRLAG